MKPKLSANQPQARHAEASTETWQASKQGSVITEKANSNEQATRGTHPVDDRVGGLELRHGRAVQRGPRHAAQRGCA